jgi:hypothetical protein
VGKFKPDAHKNKGMFQQGARKVYAVETEDDMPLQYKLKVKAIMLLQLGKILVMVLSM